MALSLVSADVSIEQQAARTALPAAAASVIPETNLDAVVGEKGEQRSSSPAAQLGQSSLRDIEAQSSTATASSDTPPGVKFDIEHMPVHDDPRAWSKGRKYGIVAIVSAGALIPAMAANVYFPAIPDLEETLNATQQTISLSLSLYILFQGTVPLLWSPVSELVGRKPVFLVAMAIFTLASGFISLSPNMATLIALRAVAAAGSSACLSIAAGTLADLFEVEERGFIVGIYYCAPITGPALAPVIGGALTEAGGWKAVFWFQASTGAASFLGYCWMKETFRTERSAAWQKARQQAITKSEEQAHEKRSSEQMEWDEQPAQRRASHLIQGVKHLAHLNGVSLAPQRTEDSLQIEPASRSHAPFNPPRFHEPGHEYMLTHDETHSERPVDMGTRRVTVSEQTRERGGRPDAAHRDALRRVFSTHSVQSGRLTNIKGEEVNFKPSLADVSPLGSATHVLKQPHNLAALLYSGTAFAAQYSLSYTATQTFQSAPYNFSPLLIGCVLLSLGAGGVFGSVIGGRISDHRLKVIARDTGRKAEPEERLKTIYIPMLVVLPAFVAYGWVTQYHTNVAASVVILIILGYAQMHAYSVTLSYMVDSNPGRTSGAVAVNSATRGLLAFVASEVSQPILSAVGNGPLQTGWAVLIGLTVVWLWLSSRRGKTWRDEQWRWPRFWRANQWSRERVGGSEWVQKRQIERETAAAGQGKQGRTMASA